MPLVMHPQQDFLKSALSNKVHHILCIHHTIALFVLRLEKAQVGTIISKMERVEPTMQCVIKLLEVRSNLSLIENLLMNATQNSTNNTP